MKVTASQLRQDVYNILDRILETGEPVVIERRGRLLRIVSDEVDRFSRLGAHPDLMVDDPDSYVHDDWSAHWKPDP